MYSIGQLQNILNEAQTAAFESSDKFFKETLGGQDSFPCGFAWVVLTQCDGKKIKGNTRVGKALKQLGVKQDYNREFQVWNPSNYMCQNVDALSAGAEAFAEVFQKYGFDAHASSRLD